MGRLFFSAAFILAICSRAEAGQDWYTPIRPCQFAFSIGGGAEPGYYSYQQANEVKNIVSSCETTLNLTQTAIGLIGGNVVQVNFDQITNGFGVVTAVNSEGALTIQKESIRAPTFWNQFHLPWTGRAEVSYGLSCNTEIFVDGSYTYAEGKSDRYTLTFPAIDLKPAETLNIKEEYGDLEMYSGNIGFRYYFPSCVPCFSLFFGTKIGARYRCSVHSRLFLADEDEDFEDLGRFSYYPAQTVVSGGLQLGLNLAFSACTSVVIMGEAIASGCYKYGKDIDIDRGVIASESTTTDTLLERSTVSAILSVPPRRVGTVFTFPVTISLRQTF